MGAIQIGEETGWPRMVVRISTLLTSRRMRGRRRRRSKADLLTQDTYEFNRCTW